MNLFEKVEFRDSSINDLFSFSSNYIYSIIYLKNNNGGDRLAFWYKYVIDGVVEEKARSTSIFRPSAGSNGFSSFIFIKDTVIKIKLRVYEENPNLNSEAEYVETAEENVADKITHVLNTAKVISELYIDPTSSNGSAQLTINDSNFLEYFDATNVKVYESESGDVLFDGPIVLGERDQYSINVTNPGKQLSTIVAEYTLKDKKTNEISKSSGVVSMYPRFPSSDGVYSELVDFFPLRTHDGKRVTKYPLFTQSNPNINNELQFDKTAVPLRNFEETKPGTAFNVDTRGIGADVFYKNMRTNSDIYANSYLSVGDQYKTINSSEVNVQLQELNFSQNENRIKPGDEIVPKLRYDDSEGNSKEIIKPSLIATECVFNVKSLNTFKFESMPPIDFNKPFYEIKTFKSEHDFVMFGSFYGTSNPIQVTTNQLKFEFDTASMSSDIYISFNYAALWYPDIDTIDYLTDPNVGESYIRPLVTSGKETVSITPDKQTVNGKSLTIAADSLDVININVGTNTYVWKKNGAVIPDKVGRFVTFDSLSESDNGSYTVEHTITPRGIKADDSSIKMVSDPFVINVVADNPISMVVKAEPTELVVDEELKVSGTITIGTNTIKSTILTKDGVEVKSFVKTDLAPEYVVASAAITDSGVYQFKIVYMDGTVERTFTSDAIEVTHDNKPSIDFTVDITVPAVEEGRQVTLVGKVNITTPPAGINYVYQWHKGANGAIVGEDDKDLVIDAAITSDAGEYWLSVLATAPDFASTLKASAHKNLVVKTDAQLKFTILAESNIVADGKPAKLSVSFSANQNASPTWDWYANDVIISGSKDKLAIEHVGYGDVIYYVKGKPTATTAIPIVTQSNTLVVKGVIAVENLTLAIEGPSEAGLGERVLFESVIANSDAEHEGNGLNPDNYSYEWFKGSTKIGSGKEIRIYAASDAGGDYTYKIISKVDPSISKISPIHKFKIKDETPMSVTLPATKSIKVGETLEITPTITPVEDVGATYQWMKNGSNVVGARSREKILILENAQKVDSGVYTLAVTIDSTPTVSTPCVVTVRDDTTPPDPEPITGEWYIHDLRPGRDHGFTWMGWWVLDEIQKAINDNFDWIADPTNERFKYQNVLKALADNKDTWEDIEIQESRNGYILLLSQLEVTGS